MISKNEVKYIQSLSDKKNRDREGLFVAEGPKLVSELMDNGLKPHLIYTTANFEVRSQVKAEVKEISQHDLQRLSHLEKANEVVAVFYKKTLPSLSLQGQLTLVLDGIQDPGNLGTIIRTADWFGIAQILATTDTVDAYNNKVVQSTMGSVARVHVYYTDIVATLATAEVPVYGALLEGENLYDTKPLTEGILVIGNESKGIREAVLPHVGKALTIPRTGGAESLNAAVAAGIILFQLVRK